MPWLQFHMIMPQILRRSTILLIQDAPSVENEIKVKSWQNNPCTMFSPQGFPCGKHEQIVVTFFTWYRILHT
jgi:hypothetical protein